MSIIGLEIRILLYLRINMVCCFITLEQVDTCKADRIKTCLLLIRLWVSAELNSKKLIRKLG